MRYPPEVILGLILVLALFVSIYYRTIVNALTSFKQHLITFLYAVIAIGAIVMVGVIIKAFI